MSRRTIYWICISVGFILLFLVFLTLLTGHLQIFSRIVGGEDSGPGQLPWQGSLRISGYHTCGCVFIGGQWVLTAAHCLHRKDMQEGSYTVMLGSNRLHDGDLSQILSFEDQEKNTFAVESWTKHPDYVRKRGSGYPNDIAVLKLKEDVSALKSIQPARLPKYGEDFTGSLCKISGWGKTDINKNDLPSTLQETSTVVISNMDCIDVWGPVIKDCHICVYNEMSTACLGDSGGPLSCGDTLAGLVSWGSHKCQLSIPGVFTRVSLYRDWIREQTGI